LGNFDGPDVEQVLQRLLTYESRAELRAAAEAALRHRQGQE